MDIIINNMAFIESMKLYIKNMSSVSLACYFDDYDRLMKKITKYDVCNVIDNNKMIPLDYASKHSSEKIFNEVLYYTDIAKAKDHINQIIVYLIQNTNINHDKINIIELNEYIDYNTFCNIIDLYIKKHCFEKKTYANEWMIHEKFIIQLMKIYCEFNGESDVCKIYSYAIDRLSKIYEDYDLSKTSKSIAFLNAHVHHNLTELLYSISITFFSFAKNYSFDNTTMIETYMNWYSNYYNNVVFTSFYYSNIMRNNIKNKHNLLQDFFIV